MFAHNSMHALLVSFDTTNDDLIEAMLEAYAHCAKGEEHKVDVDDITDVRNSCFDDDCDTCNVSNSEDEDSQELKDMRKYSGRDYLDAALEAVNDSNTEDACNAFMQAIIIRMQLLDTAYA